MRQVKFATSPPYDPTMFDDADDAHRYCHIPDLLNQGAADPEEAKQLLLMREGEPVTFTEDEPPADWRAAMTEEMASIEAKEKWPLCDLPVSHWLIGLKWVFKEKRNAASEVIKHKAHLVAKGFM